MRLLLLAAFALLAGCADTTTAILQTFKLAFGSPAPDASRADPRYRYIKLTHQGGVAYLVLGAIDKDANGPIEVWYAGDGEIVRLQNGRLAGVTGLKPEWRHVALPSFPSWSAVAATGAPLRWQRTRDLMPGYRFAVKDELVLTRAPAPRTIRLDRYDAGKLHWFEERMQSTSEEPLPPARYAVDGDTAVYGEQCLSPGSCFTWQRWTPGT